MISAKKRYFPDFYSRYQQKQTKLSGAAPCTKPFAGYTDSVGAACTIFFLAHDEKVSSSFFSCRENCYAAQKACCAGAEHAFARAQLVFPRHMCLGATVKRQISFSGTFYTYLHMRHLCTCTLGHRFGAHTRTQICLRTRDSTLGTGMKAPPTEALTEMVLDCPAYCMDGCYIHAEHDAIGTGHLRQSRDTTMS